MSYIEKLQQLFIGKEFNSNLDGIIEIIPYFDSQLIISKNESVRSNFEGHGMCNLYEINYDKIDREVVYIWVDENNIIADIK